MNDIYEQKAKKYKYKYLKLKRLKREIEYIGGWFPGKGIVDGITNYFTSNADKAKTNNEAEAVKATSEAIAKVTEEATVKKEHEDFKEKNTSSANNDLALMYIQNIKKNLKKVLLK